MNQRKICLLFFFAIFTVSSASHSIAADYPSKAQSIILANGKTPDEKAVLNTVGKVYKFSSREYICVCGAKKLAGNFVNKFSPYFSDEIVEKFFRDHEACEVVGAARYGFVPLDDPNKWSDKQYNLVRIEAPDVFNDKATVEVRFWTSLDKKHNPIDQTHGGTIVYLTRIDNKWKVSNIESTDWLGADGFHSLIDNYPSVANPKWGDMDYRKSLKNPQPFE